MNRFENNLEIISNLLQIKSYEILVHDFNNTDLMKYLAHQDELLNTIIEQNKEIIETLKGGLEIENKKNNKANSR